MRGRRLFLIVLTAGALAGCTVPPIDLPDAPSGDNIDTPSGPLMARASCSGFNGFSEVPASTVRPLVPANWTFTGPPAGDVAILRMHTAGCHAPASAGVDYLFHLVLSTPMVPDEASAHHHDNPDVILALYTNNATAVDNWTHAGIPAHLADFTWQEDAIGDVVSVTTDEGPVLALRGLNPHQDLPTRPYTFPATYAAGTTDIAWFWGHENATSRAAAFLQQDYGAGSPFPGLTTIPYSLSVWMGFDVRYEIGTPRA